MKQFDTFISAISSYTLAGLNGLLDYPVSKKARQANWVWIGLLFLSGILLWGFVFNWGSFPFNFHDWLDVSAPRFTILQDALTHGELPLHSGSKYNLGGVTSRFMSIPDAFLSPQLVFLSILNFEQFALFDTLLLFALGFWGLLKIRKKFSLSPLAFAVLFSLFNFNGHIVAHLSVGHETWGGYFLFPWFILLMFDMLEGDHSWKWVAKVSVLLFVIFLQGSYHQFVWLLFFLGFFAFSKKENFLPVFKAAVFSVLLSLVRILPPALEANAFDSKYYGGYLTLLDQWQSMISIQAPGVYNSSSLLAVPLGGWEFTLYVGIIGTLFLLYFGIYRWLRSREDGSHYYALILPLVGLSLLSLNQVFAWVRQVPFPLFSGERVSARMISVPFAFILVFAVVEFQHWLGRLRRNIPLVQISIVGLVIASWHDLWENLRTWNILSIYNAFPHGMAFTNTWVVANDYGDAAYTSAIAVGAAVSLLSMAALAVLVWLEQRQSIPEPDILGMGLSTVTSNRR
jgi:hypothetical protein